jgi:thiaminase
LVVGAAAEAEAHPAWVQDFLEAVHPSWSRVVNHRYFEDLAAGSIPLEKLRFGLVQFYALVQTFPQ